MIKKNYLLIVIAFISLSLSACNKETNEKAMNDTKPSAKDSLEPTSVEPIKSTEAITVVNPRIRALPPSQKVTAMYMQLNNSSDTARDLVRIEGSISNMIELHSHTNKNGVMSMGEVESIPVPANGSVEAQPGGYHVMIMGLKKPLNRGDKVDFKLIFKDGSDKSITAEVKDIEAH